MRELMELLCDYLTLDHRLTCGQRLSPAQHARWLALQGALPGTGNAPGPGPSNERTDDGVRVELTAHGRFDGARLMGVSRDGLRLRLRQPLALGTRTVVRVVVARTEYVYPCVVAWCDGHVMGVCFDGRPERAAVLGEVSGEWQSPLKLETGWGVPAACGLA